MIQQSEATGFNWFHLGTGAVRRGFGRRVILRENSNAWFTPEGRFEAAEQKNGLFVERVMIGVERRGEKPDRLASS
jgi:hypothetical protein